jgi:hypothetical protein
LFVFSIKPEGNLVGCLDKLNITDKVSTLQVFFSFFIVGPPEALDQKDRYFHLRRDVLFLSLKQD